MKGGYKRCEMFELETERLSKEIDRVMLENNQLKLENERINKDNDFAREQVYKYMHETIELDSKCFEKSNRVVELLKEVKDWKAYTIASLLLMCVLVVCLMVCIAHM